MGAGSEAFNQGYLMGELAKLSTLKRPGKTLMDEETEKGIEPVIPDVAGVANQPVEAPLVDLGDARKEPLVAMQDPARDLPGETMAEPNRGLLAKIASGLGFGRSNPIDSQAVEKPQSPVSLVQESEKASLGGPKEAAAQTQSSPLQADSSPGLVDPSKAQESGLSEQAANTQVTSGSVDAVSQDPQAMYQITRLAGSKIPSEMLEMAKKYELALDERNQALDEEAQQIRKRIDEGKLSRGDNILIGLAVLASTIAAGKDGGGLAALGALGHSLGATGQLLEKKQKDEDALYGKLSDLASKKAQGEMEKVKVNTQMAKAIPGLGVGGPLANREVVTQDGKVVGISTSHPDLWLLPRLVGHLDEKQIKNLESKVIPEAAETLEDAEQFNNLIDDVIGVYEQINRQIKSGILPGSISQAVGSAAPEKWYDKIKINGNEESPVAAAKQKIELLKDKYMRVNMRGNRALTQGVDKHMSRVFAAPDDPKNIFYADMDTMISLFKEAKRTLQDNAMAQIRAAGFVPELAQNKIYNTGSKSQISATGKGLDQVVLDPKVVRDLATTGRARIE